ncbi:MAG: TPM domain-containing protein [Kiritimatiellales bacterium]|nr:TPM domain-containing protein [Kiritimatiellota bacterium]MBL7011654.1 TPM domain-containing protein [Kiritimatiellales bacterium]
MRFLKQTVLIVLLACSAQASDTLLNSLRPRGPVNDFANVIPAAEENQLAAILTELQQKTGDAVVVVTLPSLDGGQIDDFANRLFERWGIGQKGKDNGILLLGATDEQRGNRLRIEVGYGLEGVLNDAAAGRILDQYVVPAWNQQQYGSAIASGGAAIAQRVAADKGIQLSGVPQYNRGYGSQPPRKSNPIMNVLFIIGFIYMAIRHPRLLLLMILMSGRGGGSRGGGGFGGGFGGFGGGMSGGGGASR